MRFYCCSTNSVEQTPPQYQISWVSTSFKKACTDISIILYNCCFLLFIYLCFIIMFTVFLLCYCVNIVLCEAPCWVEMILSQYSKIGVMKGFQWAQGKLGMSVQQEYLLSPTDRASCSLLMKDTLCVSLKSSTSYIISERKQETGSQCSAVTERRQTDGGT